jgi:hypothetical protein
MVHAPGPVGEAASRPAPSSEARDDPQGAGCAGPAVEQLPAEQLGFGVPFGQRAPPKKVTLQQPLPIMFGDGGTSQAAWSAEARRLLGGAYHQGVWQSQTYQPFEAW